MKFLAPLVCALAIFRISMAIPAGKGVAYTRWGRNDCPFSSSLIYEGYAAGALYNHAGGTSDFLCLFKDVVYTEGKFVNGNNGASFIYGVEFRDNSWIDQLFDTSDVSDGSLLYQNVPCAACLAINKITQIMIPGTDVCPDFWTAEYVGYLMAPHHSHAHEAGALCIDERPNAVPGTQIAENNAFLHMIETQCPGGLPCDPYKTGGEVRCVVCTL